MHTSNNYYGHRQILAEFTGADPSIPLRGMLQHGWTRTHGLLPKSRMVMWLPGFVWSAHNFSQCRRLGYDNTTQIGAPFLYLRDMLGTPRLPTNPSTIFYPTHSSEWDPVEGDHEELMRRVIERETGDITACLYWLEYENTRLRRSYEDAGFRVICHGRRNDPNFLRRQYDELSRHSRVVTNRMGTALLYGGALGRNIEIYGDVFDLRGDAQAVEDAHKRDFPELVSGGLHGDDAAAMCNAELGMEAQREPGELCELFDWVTGPRRSEFFAAKLEHWSRSCVASVRKGWEAA